MIKRNSKGQFVKGHKYIPLKPETLKKLRERMKGNTCGKGIVSWKKGLRGYNDSRIISGKKSHFWVKGKTKINGYWYIYAPTHPRPRKMCKVYIKQSILVMEKKIGRYIKSYKEVVHHINGIKDDDRPENLYLFPSKSKHNNYEINLLWTYKKWGVKPYLFLVR